VSEQQGYTFEGWIALQVLLLLLRLFQAIDWPWVYVWLPSLVVLSVGLAVELIRETIHRLRD
jgi:hypothetical protein